MRHRLVDQAGKAELELIERGDGTRMRLRVRAGARVNAIVGLHTGALKLSVTAAPERGRANRAVLELVAAALGLPASSLSIVSGRSSPDKTLRVPLAPAVIAERLSGATRGKAGPGPA